jgi:hypothetical protein
MDECTMTVVIQTDSYRALTDPSLTRMTLLTQILLVNLVINYICAFPLNRNRTGAMPLIGRHAAQCGH